MSDWSPASSIVRMPGTFTDPLGREQPDTPEHRYWLDPEYHAVCHLVAQLVAWIGRFLARWDR